MTASRSDMWQLSQDATFQNRIQASLLSACEAISTEGFAVAFHRERADFVMQVLKDFANPNPYVIAFAETVATDSNVISDATVAGTVVLTPANRAAQAALITDAHIDTAVSAQFNSFVREPGN